MSEHQLRPISDIQEDRSEVLHNRADGLWRELAGINPETLAARTGATYHRGDGEGEFRFELWGQPVRVSQPEFATSSESGEPLDPTTALLIAYYFSRADGTPGSGDLIAFSELPNAAFYAQAFQSYTGAELARAFGDDIDSFGEAAAALSGRPESIADRAFSFPVLPLVRVTVACWLGDEDFASSYRILFDAALDHHLPTDAGAILGSTITQRLIAAHHDPD